MDFIQHTFNWIKGEILEGTIITIVGFIIISTAFLFWKFGNTPNAKALIIPLLITGLIPLVLGIAGIYSYKTRIPEYTSRWEQNPGKFIQAEKERVEGFDNIFKYSYPAAIIMVVGGAILFFLFKSPNIKAISLALMLMGIMAYFIDFFAAERAGSYLKEINSYEKTISTTTSNNLP